MFFHKDTSVILCLIYVSLFVEVVRSYGNANLDEQESSSSDLLEDGKFKEASEKFEVLFASSGKKMYSELSGALKVAAAGTVYFKDGQFAEAAALYQEAVEASRGRDAGALGAATQAARVFSRCGDASLLAIRGHLFLKQGNFPESVAMFRTARDKVRSIQELASTLDNCINVVSIASVGKSLLVAGNFKESTDVFQRAYDKSEVDAVALTLLNLKTQSGYAWEGLSSIIQLKCFDNASKSFQNAYEKSTILSFYYTFSQYRDAANIAKQGSDFMKLGKFSDALEQFQKAINIFHISAFSSYINATKCAVQGLEKLTEGNALEALELFQKALLMRRNIFPGDVDVLMNCKETLSMAAAGHGLMSQRKFHEALVKFHEAYSKSTVREVKYMLSRLKKLPYEGGNYCSHEDFAAVEHA